jgi:hypothetical protein
MSVKRKVSVSIKECYEICRNPAGLFGSLDCFRRSLGDDLCVEHRAQLPLP